MVSIVTSNKVNPFLQIGTGNTSLSVDALMIETPYGPNTLQESVSASVLILSGGIGINVSLLEWLALYTDMRIVFQQDGKMTESSMVAYIPVRIGISISMASL
ncbi:MAG: hypothetical protein HYZ34_13210 [Ignavibacteriae bacterium]|nr:hypothetical protein [Ignavibacteriota bacterium]